MYDYSRSLISCEVIEEKIHVRSGSAPKSMLYGENNIMRHTSRVQNKHFLVRERLKKMHVLNYLWLMVLKVTIGRD